MLNSDLHLSFDTLDESKLRLVPMRDGFGRGLVEAGEQDANVVVLCGDLTESTRTLAFKEAFPERYVEVGVAEQNMAALAAGLAAAGKRPVIASFAVFSPGRNWEQVRTTIALNDMPVVIAGHHTGLSAGADGATHQALEDITMMRVLPNMQTIVPADAEEARKAVHAALESKRPTYVRISRDAVPAFTTPESPFEIGRAEYLWHSERAEVALIGAGPILYRALIAARALEEEGIGTSVLNVHSVKPMDIERVLEAVRNAGAVVTLEEHQILGGIGGTIAEITAQNTPIPIEMVAVHDRFGQSGTAGELEAEYRLSTETIIAAVKRVRERKA